MASLFQCTLLLTHQTFPSVYISYTNIKGNYSKQRQLECKPSACQSNKQHLEHFVKKNRETGVSIIERDIIDHHQGTFLQIETRKISYILSCVRGLTLATIHAVLWFILLSLYVPRNSREQVSGRLLFTYSFFVRVHRDKHHFYDVSRSMYRGSQYNLE